MPRDRTKNHCDDLDRPSGSSEAIIQYQNAAQSLKALAAPVLLRAAYGLGAYLACWWIPVDLFGSPGAVEPKAFAARLLERYNHLSDPSYQS
jgi:hypothetical protein